MRLRLLALAAVGLLAACSEDAPAPSKSGKGSGAKAGAADGDGVTFAAESKPLDSFSFDTGLIPAGSPAQVSFKLAAGGAVKVAAQGSASKGGLEGKKGSGKVDVDLHFKMDGRLKVTSMLKNVDEDLPGLKDIDVAIKGTTSFDPFLVKGAESARLEATVPATELPEIPLGTVPGKLKLKVAEGSTLKTSFKGSCLTTKNGKATYTGALTTSGTLILQGTLAVDLPAPLNKEVDLGEIAVPIPAGTTVVDFPVQDADGAGDATLGDACGGKKSTGPEATSTEAGGPRSTDQGAPSAPPATSPDKVCIAKTCESVMGRCGDHDDGCGGTFSCGVCPKPPSAPQCVPLSCAQIGKTCGVHADGCGSVMNCGVCPTVCPSDSREPNNTEAQAVDLGKASDWDNTARSVTALASADGDEDWFKIRVADEGFGGNPLITASTTDLKLEVTVFHVCDSKPDYSYCSSTGAQDNAVGKGCRALGNVTLKTDCSGISEDGTTYVRVRKAVSDAKCHSYDLKIEVQ